MPKWKRKFNQYLKKHPRKIVSHEVSTLGSPFSFGDCVLWKKGEEEAYKRKLEEEDEKKKSAKETERRQRYKIQGGA